VPGSVKQCIPMLLGFSVFGRTDVVDVQEFVRRATNVMRADWAAAPDFAFIQRDVASSRGITTSKTHQVFIASGSDYYMPIAINGEALPPDQQTLELQKLKQEVVRRSQETQQQAQRRSDRYRKLREQNGILLNEFTKAFDFTFAGEEITDGRATYVLDAKPSRAYRPPNRTARILTGMQGRLWIDQQSFHWAKAEAEVVRPVSIFGLFARALPGTRMNLEMMPVTDSVWLVSRLTVDMRFSIFWHKSVKSTETIFSGYEPAPAALARWLSTAPGGPAKNATESQKVKVNERGK
jgi:hypothetical protein